MDQDWRTLATQRAEYASDRLRGLLSSGVDFLRTELGVDLGLKPEKYPSWAILSVAVIALTVLVVVAACGRRKRRTAPVTATSSPRTAAETQIKATLPPKTVKTEPSEPKKKNKKKAADKKAQENGQTVAEPKEEIKVTEKKKTPPAPAPVQPPVDAKAKKTKKKPKPEVKATQDVSSSVGKEPDEGAWETKVSNREKRQQRKKEKGPGDSSGSPESSDRASWKVEQPAPVPSTATKKNKESSRPKAGKDEAVTAPVIFNRIDANTVNGGGWTVKHQTQMNASNNEKRPVSKKAHVHKNRENSWKPESEGPLTGLDGRSKVEPKPANLTMLGLNTSGGEPGSQSNIERCSDAIDNEWSSCNGLAAVDPSSDWNAPTELWGNYEEPKNNAPLLKETPISKPLGESNDDNDNADPAGSGKSKRRKKKKRPEEEGSASELIQESSAPAEKNVTVKPLPPHVPKEDVFKQNIPPPSSQKKSDQNWEPPKQVQKKKVRRET
ncbi:metadherin a isoform X4 [Triplophysa rosa]|uniref:metadherin a isoform X4 n=1 Tax=Triplophysa rosa TaxID=992332 RepID=UPI0025461CD1|nr:metadherin a isoform X4 [Triplophysa rosa]